MANLLNRYKQHVQSVETTIVDFMPTIDSIGDFQKIKNLQVIINSWKNILLIPLGTYDHDPTMGSKLFKYIFEPFDEFTRNNIINEINFRLPKFDDRAEILDVEVESISGNKGFVVIVLVSYQGEKGELVAQFDEESFFEVITN